MRNSVFTYFHTLNMLCLLSSVYVLGTIGIDHYEHGKAMMYLQSLKVFVQLQLTNKKWVRLFSHAFIFDKWCVFVLFLLQVCVEEQRTCGLLYFVTVQIVVCCEFAIFGGHL